jgi:hypothetical protein
MWNLVGRVGSLFTGAGRLPRSFRPGPTSGAGKVFQALGGIENASLGLGAMMYGSDLLQQQMERMGLIPTIKKPSAGGSSPPRKLPPAPDLNTSLYGGPQAGQLTPPVPPLIGAGAVSNGAGVPAQRENVLNRSLSQEVLNAAQQYSAPTSVPLSAFYEGQQQLGRSMMQKGNLVSELQALGAGTGMTPENLQQWVKANPGLAYREMLRLKQM